ncbi:hypothetical protein Pint_30461 [Pistacia integerrima]|uniref:Uncharacterized protein n=1 Tax=Pistacia integerrima TaxID=434235 RepID=A0ACC0X2A7_9ROSI|nr:hypothetical protein Pint_30461 [Pistacia integerrima]
MPEIINAFHHIVIFLVITSPMARPISLFIQLGDILMAVWLLILLVRIL